jgi:pimeloyl-ACP methyl ester carboxylesterase
MLSAALAALGAAGAVPAHADAKRDTFVEGPCPSTLKSDANVRFRCGELKVPEVRNDPESSLLTIPLTIISPASAAADPVVMLHGGPGAPAHASAQAQFAAMPSTTVSMLLAGRSWIFFDQRGVGMWSPPLNCPLPKSLVNGYTPDEASACAATLQSQGRKLEAYNSVTAAQDIEALRIALGFERFNLVGASYGSRLAFTYARLYPNQVRAIVHDGPYTPAEQETVDDARGVDAVLRRVAQPCAAAAACAKRHPNLEARFVASLTKLASRPVNGVTDAFAVQELRSMAFGHDIEPLPSLMDRVARVDVASLAKQLRQAIKVDTARLKIPPQDLLAFGQSWSVDCNEEKSFESKNEYSAARGTSPIIDASLTNAERDIDICAVWPSGKADPIENTLAIVTVPQLVLTGEFDVSQSGIVGTRITEAMPAARDVVFVDTGHVQLVGPKAD